MANARGDLPQAIEFLEESITIARGLRDTRAVATGLNSLANTLQIQDKLEQAMSTYREALGLARELGDRGLVSMVTGNIADVYLDQGEVQAGLREARASLNLAEEIGSLFMAASLHWAIGRAQIELKEYPSARERLRKSLQLAKELGSTASILVVLVEYGRLRAREGDQTGALSILGLVSVNSGLDAYGRRRVNHVLAEIRSGVPEGEIEDGLDRGTKLDLAAVVQGLLEAA
jgi:tetratricopeptide (TPR) repeat protein